MSSQHARPKWWQLYLAFPLLIALFVVDSRIKTSERGHQAVQIVIVLIVFGLIHRWLKTNSAALSRMDQIENHSTFTVIHIPPYQSAGTETGNQPMFHLSSSEIKGVLQNTFEMDHINSDLISKEVVTQELDKE